MSAAASTLKTRVLGWGAAAMTARPVPADYAHAETRGKLRLWKAALRASYRAIDRLSDRQDDLSAFCLRGSDTGRKRAFARISKTLAAAGATLEGVRIDGKSPIAVWSILQSRGSVAVNPEDAADAQDCIVVNYVVAARLISGAAHYGDGLWTMEVFDHAVARLLHRSPTADPAACIAQAHHAALRLRHRDVILGGLVNSSFQFLLPAGPGAFVASMISGLDISNGNTPILTVRAHTWISNDMLYENQVLLIDDGTPGERLGDSWLLPALLKQTAEDDAGVSRVVAVWAPGMPETLAAPRGRA